MKSAKIIVFTLYTLCCCLFSAGSVWAESTSPKREFKGFTIPASIQWYLGKAFGLNGRSNNMRRLTGVKTDNIRDRENFGVKTRTITQTLSATHKGSRRSVLGSRKRLFSGRSASGFRR